MSGICGIISFDPGAPVEGIERMTGAAPWRGPDGTGVWRGDGAVLAHQALHVTPESRYEEQPLVDEEAGLVLVADARIDNRDELQRTLRRDLRRSVRRDVITDADLILAAYRRWGTDCAAHLLGDFAFAVWDWRKRQLFAARDPMAMRPFYYRIEENRVLFGSEVKQILAAPDVPREIFEPMVAMHLCGRFDRLDWTFYEGIAQLEPAHALVVTPDGGYRTWRYWDIDPTHQIRYPNEQDYVEHFRELFKEAVRCRLRSHKPVGLFLSGGVDSGSIASMAGHLKQTEGLPCPDFRTYSYVYPTLIECREHHISDRICQHFDFAATYIDAEAVTLIGPPDGVPDEDEPFTTRYQARIVQGLRTAKREGVASMMTGRSGDLVVGGALFDNLGLLARGHLYRLAEEVRAQKKEYKLSTRRCIDLFILDPAKEFAKTSYSEKLWFNALRNFRRRNDGIDDCGLGWASESIIDDLPGHPDKGAGSPFRLSDFNQLVRAHLVSVPIQIRSSICFDRLAASMTMNAVDPWGDKRLIELVTSIPQSSVCYRGRNKTLALEAISKWLPEEIVDNFEKVSPLPLYKRSITTTEHSKVCAYLRKQNRFVRTAKLDGVLERFSDHDAPDIWTPLSFNMWYDHLFNHISYQK